MSYILYFRRGLAQQKAARKRLEAQQKQEAAKIAEEHRRVLVENQENFQKLRSGKISGMNILRHRSPLPI